jgi:hypothetical protein
MVIEDRGYLDGDTITKLKRERRVDVAIPLRSDMLAYEDSLITAYHPDSGEWEKHPTRENQEIKRIEHADYMWEELLFDWQAMDLYRSSISSIFNLQPTRPSLSRRFGILPLDDRNILSLSL